MTHPSQDTYQQVTQKATRGMGWNYLSLGLGKGLTLITLSILAHLLPPENFGLVALATLTMDYLSVFKDLGLSAAIIQRQKSREESTNIAFILNILAGLLLTSITFLLAPFASQFFQETDVVPVLRWLGLTFLIGSFGSVHNVLLQRDLNFKKKLIPDLGNTIIKAIISISLAINGFGVWSLVIGQLAGSVIAACLLWVVMPWRPRLAWDGKIAKELLRYGLSIMGDNMLTIWVDSFDYLVIGKIYTAALLGIYTLAYRLPEMLVINILWTLTAVLFPAFSALQDEKETLKKIFLSVVHYVELIVVPICIGMVVAADPIVRVFFGEQWTGSIPVLRVLSLYALVTSIGFNAGDIYKAIGRPDILLKIAIPVFIIRITCIWIGAQFSILGVAFGHLVAALIATTIQLVVASHILAITIKDIIKGLRAYLSAAALVVCALPALFLTKDLQPVVQLVTVVLAGATGYIASMWAIERDSLIKAARMIGIKRAAEPPG